MAPFTARVLARFSTDARCNRTPWLTITIALDAFHIHLDNFAAAHAAHSALARNLTESWTQPTMFPGEREFKWYLDDILTEKGSTIGVQLSVASITIQLSTAVLRTSSLSLHLDRHDDYAMDLDVHAANVNLILKDSTIAEGGVHCAWAISGDFQQTRSSFQCEQFLLWLFPDLWKSLHAVTMAVSPTPTILALRGHTVYSPWQCLVSTHSDLNTASHVMEVEIDISQGLIQVVVPSLAYAAYDLLIDRAQFGQLPNSEDAVLILRACPHWPSLVASQLIVLLRQVSSSSLLTVLRYLCDTILKQLEGSHDPDSLYDNCSRLKEHELGLLVYVISRRSHYASTAFDVITDDNHIARLLIQYWDNELWPCRSDLMVAVPHIRCADEEALCWASPACSREMLVISQLSLMVQAPQYLLRLMQSIRQTAIQDQFSIATQFQSAMALSFQSPCILSDLISEKSWSAASSSQLIALLLHCMKSQTDPIIPYRARTRLVVLDLAVGYLPQWSRHLLLALAHFLQSLKVGSDDLQAVCDVLSSALVWTEPVGQHQDQSHLSTFLQALTRARSDSALVQNVLIGATPSKPLLAPISEFVFHVTSIEILFIEPSQNRAVCLALSLSATKHPASFQISVLSATLFGYRIWNRNWKSGYHRLISLSPSSLDHDAALYLYVDRNSDLTTSKIVARVSNIAASICLADLYNLNAIIHAFLESRQRLSRRTSGGNYHSMSIHVELQGLSVSLCGNDFSIGEDGIREAFFSMWMSPCPLIIKTTPSGTLALCSFSAVFGVDFLQPNVAIWEPLLEPFTLQFSLNHNGAAPADHTPVTPSPSMLQASFSDHNTFHDISVMIRDTVRANFCPETVSSLVALLVADFNPAPSTCLKACAFTLQNSTG